MTYHRDPWLACDADGCLVQFPADAGEIDFEDRTIGEVRQAAREAGWSASYVGDWCPEHAAPTAKGGENDG